MKFTNKRTKIITTIGPASETEAVMKALFEAGMTTIRLNFSHGDSQEQLSRVVIARKISADLKLPISIMLDTKGPEIRVGKMVGGKQPFTANQKVTIYTDTASYQTKECSTGEMTVAYDMSKDLSVGKVVLVDDGKLQIDVTEVKPGVVIGVTKNAHVVKTNKRVNLPGTVFSMPFLAEKDIQDIRLAAREKLDYIAASFVNTPEDVEHIRRILKEENAEHIKIISKVESQYAVDHFDEVLAASDAIMVARGDLGLEIPYYEVPVAQKMMIRKARAAGKPIIVATQMLDSMENNPHPTRAEVTDVYMAIEQGADATMLSGESAAGNYPVEAVEVMSTIDSRAEKEFYNKVYYAQYLETLPTTKPGSRQDIAKKVALQTKDSEFKFAVVLSRTGQLLTAVSNFRPNINIIGISPDAKQYTLHGITSSVFMYWDVNAFAEIKKDHKASSAAIKHFGGKSGDKFLVVENDKITEHTL